MGLIRQFTAEQYESRVYLQRAIYHLTEHIRLNWRVLNPISVYGDLDAINLLAIRLRNTL